MKNKRVDVYYTTKKGVKPTQGYEGDFAFDIYSSSGVLIPPLTFKSVAIPTDFKIDFDPHLYGMKINIRSGIAAKTPLVLSNGTGIVEGTYRDGIAILVRNTFIDNRLVDFVFNEEGEKLPVKKVPLDVLRKAREFYDNETTLLEYGGVTPEVEEKVYKTHVPAGTIYVPKHTRIAQIHFQEKVHATFIKAGKLTDTERGERGLGSSGTKLKG